MPTVVDLLAERLPNGLVHPGNNGDQPAKPIPLPGLSSAGIPQGMAEQFAKDAGLPASDAARVVAEAILHLLTSEGWSVVRTDVLEQTQAQANTPTPGTAVEVYCTCSRTQPLLTVATGRQRTTLNAPALKARIHEVCTCPT